MASWSLSGVGNQRRSTMLTSLWKGASRRHYDESFASARVESLVLGSSGLSGQTARKEKNREIVDLSGVISTRRVF